ncbi:rod shape-determining protein MreC [Waterburya agarophytonicola K14]|uniref:Cell shape-determining protein MreC n=1 Tax=Waterburya agarophytonicola KI4 TaxID=2874699 RepID=A0A964FJ76_9CYAN|nr:rod shape-determining protein MreC [Waterburya agarophytonicola]MCC0178964.1 rod shape-determining protein MreC [Waterburya agarophytonicola KI4]
MSRWWDRYGFRTILVLMALAIAFSIKLTQAGVFAEAYYFVVSPFQSQKQLVLEDRLTNARILELEQRLTELEQQNQQLKQLLEYQEATTEKTIVAPIIARSRDRWWNRVTLGKGSADGIEKGYIVMGIGGVVGRVTHVTSHTSKVLLISDTTSRVGATLARSRQLGYVRGKDSSTAVMKFFNQVTDIKPGDEITTSHLSKLYPPGLPIGKIKSHHKIQNTTSEVEIELTAPIDILEWVDVQFFKPEYQP